MKTSNKRLSFIKRAVVILTVMTLTVLPVLAASYPKPKNNVADEAGVLSESTIKSIETANKTLELDTDTTIAVCTVDTTGDTEIAEYARGVFKEWKLGEGVLLLIAKDDNNYYFVQSVGVSDVLTNDVLMNIRDEYLEADFNDGNIDRGVNKCVTKLKNVLTAGIKADTDDGDDKESESKGTTFGSVVAGFFKTILYIILIAVVLLVAFFVGALFNDDIMILFRRYILRIPEKRRMPEEYYDERLYGNPKRRNPQNDRYNGNRNRNSQGYSQNRQGGQYPNRQGQNRRPSNPQMNQQYPRQQNRGTNRPVNNNHAQNRGSYDDAGETRAFSIPTRGDNYNNYR